MPSLTSLPNELIEDVTQYLDLDSLRKLRLSQPTFFPAPSVRRLKQLHPWNAAEYQRGATLAISKADNPQSNLHRLDSWCGVLCKLAAHPLFSTWITSVCILNRPCNRGCRPKGAPVRVSLSFTGLGQAISTLPKLSTLRISGVSEGDVEVAHVIDDLCASQSTPPIQFLVIEDLHARPEVLGRLFCKLNGTLEEVVLMDVALEVGLWVKEIFANLQRCDLKYLKVMYPHAVAHWLNGRKHKVGLQNMNIFKLESLDAGVKLAYTEKAPGGNPTVMVETENCQRAMEWLMQCRESKGSQAY